MEDLTSKSQHLKAELDRTIKQLKEVTAIAVNEAEKCKSANDVVESLTAQVRSFSDNSFVLISFFSITYKFDFQLLCYGIWKTVWFSASEFNDKFK